jgi:hypothetical protein
MDKAKQKETLLVMTKEELVELFLLALEATQTANQNMLEMTTLMTKVNTEAQQLRDEKATLEAELIVLRNRP